MSETVVVGFIGDEISGRALDRAIEIVRDAGGKVVVVVVEAMPVEPGTGSMVNLDLAQVREPVPLPVLEPTPELQRVIDSALERTRAAGVAAESVWGFGDPARTIVDAATDQAATKIVVGAGHHGFLSRLLAGDVEADVRREADCEVVVVE